MTEKRFSIKSGSTIGLSSIYTDNGKVMTQLEVLDVLIKQYETIQTLTKENEQLKSENNRLVNETAKVVAEHQRKVLNLIDRKIKDYNQQLDDEDIDDNLAYYMNVKGHIEALQDLKKELLE